MKLLYKIVIFSLLIIPGAAQTRKPKPKAEPLKPPVEVIEQARLYQSGDVHVDVTGNSTPTIKLGLAQGAFINVEFPADDRIFAIHPGDPDLVTFDDTFAEKKYHFAMFRPGSNFTAPEKGHGPQTTIGVQMDSGLFVVFVIYPVKNMAENAHRCVISYKRADIVRQRAEKGLQIDLIGDGKSGTEIAPPLVKKDPPKSTIIAPKQEEPVLPPVEQPKQQPVRMPETKPAIGTKPTTLPKGGKDEQKGKVQMSDASTAPPPRPREMMPAEAKNKGAEQLSGAWSQQNEEKEKKGFNWFGLKKGKEEKAVEKGVAVLSDPVTESTVAGISQGRITYGAGGHGLMVTAWEGANGAPETMQVFVEVRNISSKGLKLLPDTPDVSVETFGPRKNRLNIEPVMNRQIKGIPNDFWMNPGAVCLLEVRFTRPTIGVSQRLVISVGHTLAADAPVIINVTGRK